MGNAQNGRKKRGDHFVDARKLIGTIRDFRIVRLAMAPFLLSHAELFEGLAAEIPFLPGPAGMAAGAVLGSHFRLIPPQQLKCPSPTASKRRILRPRKIQSWKTSGMNRQ
jgi:hypothetical protein